MSPMVTQPGSEPHDVSEDAWALVTTLQAMAALLRPAMALPDPLPAELTETEYEGHRAEPVLILGTAGTRALIVTRDGHLGFVGFDDLKVKFPPDGQYRLLFGWAEKGRS